MKVPELPDEEESTVRREDEGRKREKHERNRAYLIVIAGGNVGEIYKLVTKVTTIGRSNLANIRVDDDGVSRRHAQVVVEGENIVIRDLGSKNGTYLNGDSVAEHGLADGDKIQIGTTVIFKFSVSDSLDEQFQRQMYESALIDGLTKVYNKKHFQDRLQAELAFALRHKSPLSLVMIDIDFFKKVNDSHGHLAGDSVLSALAQLMAKTLRQEDVLARYGGEEFAIICREIELANAVKLGERIRRLVEQHPFKFNDIELKLTVSVGVAALPPTGVAQPTELVALADTALYQAKHQGRNRVVPAPAASSTTPNP